MSTPDEAPQPQQPGAQPPQQGNVPPAGYQPPGGYQPPQGGTVPPGGYQGQQGYQPPTQPGQFSQPGPAQGGPGQPAPGQPGFHFEMPTDGPRHLNDVMPQGGFSGIFKTQGLPTELKVSYFIWVISGLLALLFGLIGFFAIIAAFAFIPGVAAFLLVLLILSLAVAAAQIVLAMKMKEGKEWARLALTILAAVSLLLAIFGSINSGAPGAGLGGNWFGFLVSAVAVVLMWLPNSQLWFKAIKGHA
ncbi:hypothetical protein [Paenarthrobacter sp. AB444]|uniref:hypothetical protein n=1 Tax=Paenarthrobacter sp. AB444 TaxID=3025681 RepID=UPI0023670685|nr:hypothetical protein [Paenarthrobacter sp. AB444]MDD7835547.1 hypothetical protein [Paenarthrobacter sp. AB444]